MWRRREAKLSDYRLEESQSGDQVHFLFKEKPQIGVHFHVNWHRTSAKVTVETPADLTLEARTSDGNLRLASLNGELGSRPAMGMSRSIIFRQTPHEVKRWAREHHQLDRHD